MITKAQVKHISSLVDKKYRIEFNEFVVEGEKSVAELLKSKFSVKEIFALLPWIKANEHFFEKDTIIHEVNISELERVSLLQQPQNVLAIVELPSKLDNDTFSKAILLDTLQDPGNMGSIIRIADWFGISHVFCHGACVDAFSPKVVQATMGSIFRVHVETVNAIDFLQKNNKMPSFAAVLGGKDVRTIGKINEGIIIIGNESKGVHPDIIALSSEKVMIPRKGEAESLNAAIATGILCYALL